MAEEKESTSVPLSQAANGGEDPEDPAKSPPSSPNSSTRKSPFELTHAQVVKELLVVEEFEALDNIVGASFSSDGIATPFSAMVPVASTTIPIEEARREGGKMLHCREAKKPGLI
ncbi:protein like cov 2 [Quercus suber]|uniref:Protein like cov 2 n=1 Tax=Quercus suber TaxID=58331 RepID=A0AAW0LXY5_QUESU